jgi:hypothetical protein
MKMFPTLLLASGVISAPIVAANIIRLPTIPYQETSSPPKIVVSKTQQVVEKTNDPIWEVQLIVDNKVVDKVEALIGRANKQTANRHIAGNKSPLPIGNYSIIRSEIYGPPFSEPELGEGYWIPISPLFGTARSALGIHQDPSWGKLNGESGTSGCIGVKTKEDTTKIVNWIQQYNIRELVVDS